MAKATDSEDKKPRKRGTTVMGWLLLAMLVAGLGGFGVTNFGATGSAAIGSVGSSEGKDL